VWYEVCLFCESVNKCGNAIETINGRQVSNEIHAHDFPRRVDIGFGNREPRGFEVCFLIR
jgi:hypothetical protein